METRSVEVARRCIGRLRSELPGMDLEEAHCDILWGEDFRDLLPPVPSPQKIAHRFLIQRAQRIAVLEDSALGRKRALYAAYKAAVVLQLVHGESTLDKRRMQELFVPPSSPTMRTAAWLSLKL